ncbi:sensor histidine kinase [Streptomyces sp. NPDC093105]|uniref:sensor histidine kinase n=1 Tax=Streptomyces sp. NPDC093105 TaxID=3366029 RepID=UPI0038011E7F
MSATSAAPLRKRMTPGWWAAIAWLAGLLFTVLLRLRLPGQESADVLRGVVFLRWDGLTMLVLATALALRGSALLDRRPTAALGHLLAAAVLCSFPLGVTAIPLAQYLAVDVALYTIASHRPTNESDRAAFLAVGVVLGHLAVRLLAGWSAGTTTALAVLSTAGAVWLVGRSARQNRLHAEETRARAAEQAVIAERLRIAREMHDTVAHSIGIVALQAGAARLVIDKRPELAREALGEIETASRETLAGLRRMLGALRTADTADAPDTVATPATPADVSPDVLAEPAPPAPAAPPGLASLDRLAETTGAAGVRVTVRRVGAPRPLPPDIDLSAFRVLQESVTNVVRHSGADTCTITVDHRDPDTLALTVEDPGPGPGAATGRRRDRAGGGGSGYGLVGMRERVGLLHGEFTAGPRPGGGFRVTAHLPVPSGAAPA